MNESPMQAEVAVQGLFVGCNGISNAFSGNHADAITSSSDSLFCGAFGASHSVALLQNNPKANGALQIAQMLAPLRVQDVAKDLANAKATTANRRISAVYLYDQSPSSRFVVAGDSLGSVTLWKWSPKDGTWCVIPAYFSDAAMIGGVSSVKALETRRFGWLFMACFTNGSVVVFREVAGESTADHTSSNRHLQVFCALHLDLKCLMETIDAFVWASPMEEEETILIALGGVDMRVHVYELVVREDHEVESSTVTQQPEQAQLHSLVAMEGHRGWIRRVAFQHFDACNSSSSTDGRETSICLASCSQDQKIRLWRINLSRTNTKCDSSSMKDQVDGLHERGSVAKSATGNWTISCRLDALLVGHEDWVTWLEWKHPDLLVSCSMDNTMMLWHKPAPNSSNSQWRSSGRVGELGGNGLLSCATCSCASDASATDEFQLLALNFSGQIDRWKQVDTNGQYLPALSVTGHCSQVTDLCWSPRGDYLLSVSLDQTARILASCCSTHTWHEISRSQVHGYDINCACFVHDLHAHHEDRYVCGADEKILRVFRAPDDFTALVRQMQGRPVTSDELERPKVQFAYAPELSLTNKLVDIDREPAVVEATSTSVESTFYALGSTGQELILQLPVSETLSRKTLWPEMKKLYGHGNELLCVSSNWQGSLIASACKSREEQFASVWLWDTSSWKPSQTPLMGHKSSVVQLAFAPNDQFLASVSKDRHLCIYGKTKADDDAPFALVFKFKAHKRIIWSCSWSSDSKLIMTGSRDQTFALWGFHHEANSWCQLGHCIAVGHSVTAVAFAPIVLDKGKYLAAVGLENGTISLFCISIMDDTSKTTTCNVVKLLDLDVAISSSAAITRLAWNPQRQALDSSLQLAVSSLDHSVRIFHVGLSKAM